MKRSIVMLGAFDSKGAEYAFLRQILLDRGFKIVAVDTGVMDAPRPFPVDVAASEVARAGGGELASLQAKKDRGEAMKVMAAGAPVIAKKLLDAGRLDGIIGMGGTAGTTVATAAMRALPIGIPSRPRLRETRRNMSEQRTSCWYRRLSMSQASIESHARSWRGPRAQSAE
jgi:uncharacterized protein (UPF0261 family)